MMYELIEALVELIKEEDVYKNFVKESSLLENEEIHSMLVDYQFKKDEYTRMKPYAKYQDISTYQKAYLDAKQDISNNDVIKRYYSAYYELNDLLDELTDLVFKGISDEIVNERYSL